MTQNINENNNNENNNLQANTPAEQQGYKGPESYQTQQSSGAQPGMGGQPGQPTLSNKERKKMEKMAKAQARTTEDWMKREKKIVIIFSIVCAVLLILAIIGFASTPSYTVTYDTEYETGAPAEYEESESSEIKNATDTQRNALRAAENYLDSMPMSKQGLIGQLEFDKFSREDSEWAVAHLKVDWNKQAERAGVQYVNTTGYSYEGLVDQLIQGDQFTRAQAEHGAKYALKLDQ